MTRPIAISTIAAAALSWFSLGCSSKTPSQASLKANSGERSYRICGSLNASEIDQIEALVRNLTDDPIMSIQVMDNDVISVMTGVVRGPLNGGGRFYDFKKENGKWVRTNTDSPKDWVS